MRLSLVASCLLLAQLSNLNGMSSLEIIMQQGRDKSHGPSATPTATPKGVIDPNNRGGAKEKTGSSKGVSGHLDNMVTARHKGASSNRTSGAAKVTSAAK